MAHARRMSESGSFTFGSFDGGTSLIGSSSAVLESSFIVNEAHSKQWIEDWEAVYARDIVDSKIISVDADSTVEDACDRLLSEDIICLAVNSPDAAADPPYLGLFDFSDVNAFLTLAATRHTLLPDDSKTNPRVNEIVSAAKAGRVPVQLVSNLSEKNPLETLPYDATIVSLLKVFSRGAHRVLIRSNESASQCPPYLGFVTDRGLLSWFSSYASKTPSVLSVLAKKLATLDLPSLYMYDAVVACSSTDNVLHAMKLMSEEGVSSAAVIEEVNGSLLSAVSVTDVGKIVVPSQSNQILATPLNQFVSYIKAPDGSTDGVDKYPVYSVFTSSTLDYTIQKLLATNAHRVFVTDDSLESASPILSAAPPSLCGIISVVDVLSLFARLANIPDVDPSRMRRHRRASSSSTSPTSSRSSSRRGSMGIRLSSSPISRTLSIGSPGKSMPIPVGGMRAGRALDRAGLGPGAEAVAQRKSTSSVEEFAWKG